MDKILFHINADVIAAHEKRVGSLERVVLNPETKVITDIVVETGTLFDKESKVVPIEFVEATSENHIKLSDTVDNWQDFPPLEERHLVDGNGNVGEVIENEPPVVFGSPILGPSNVPAALGEPINTQIERNIPDETIALNKDTKVITMDGKHVGNVERVLADSDVDQMTHVGISTGVLTKEKRLIPIKWILKMDEDEITLQVSKEAIEELADTSMAS